MDALRIYVIYTHNYLSLSISLSSSLSLHLSLSPHLPPLPPPSPLSLPAEEGKYIERVEILRAVVVARSHSEYKNYATACIST